ncbi:IclR family transcriptional regulator [Halomonas sp. MCCC 1A17488]|uniref:IclR family transcriptional regulator n=1 Tax=unclassified Halomonas TaxID=2609666 RepID=UPI0018D23729|nr:MULTISPECIES: IclR family transcriptional regulator [unclassified Halomonas]MCE8015798.1 IclR family transcriptional regulator [Halomonas sp. MCCC 1A17488]MCG3239131.1 IclR family transcriptional regulator [Halomonas sp. MCCC 1A17488]QPP50926.1 IclR family transcriptional regulator [Halomonas sp. SS10-MC5]
MKQSSSVSTGVGQKAPSRPESVKTAARTLSLFEAFAEAQTPLALTDLAKRIDAPVSSCHALVKTLQTLGYVYVLEQKKRVYPTKRLLQIAQSIASHDPLLESVSPLLQDLRDELGETVILGKRQDSSVVYLDIIEGTHTVRYAASPGDAKPLHSSAIGKAMLGEESGMRLQSLLECLPLPSVTASTITDRDQLLDDILNGQRRGYFVTRGENVDDVMALAIARPVFGETLGLAIAGPMERMSRHYERYREALIRHGDRLASL